MLIGTAIAGGAALLIADEPTTALDMTVQRQILSLLRARRDAGDAVLLISHDLAVVAELADRVLVMRGGRIVEQGPARRVERADASVHAAAARGDSHCRVARVPARSHPRVPLPPKRIDTGPPVLAVDALTKRYGGSDTPAAVDGVSFTLARGETLGIVGESGSGKSTVARIVLAVEPDNGTVALDGQPWNGVPEAARRARAAVDRTGSVQLVRPTLLGRADRRRKPRCGRHPWRRAAPPRPAAARRSPARRRLHRPVSARTVRRQRVAIARAFASNPALLVADEPVSALDVSIQAQVLDLLADLQAEHGTAMLFISHDLGVVHHVADRILMMRGGRVVESGPVDRVFGAPSHPYTASLLDALPLLPDARAALPLPAVA